MLTDSSPGRRMASISPDAVTRSSGDFMAPADLAPTSPSPARNRTKGVLIGGAFIAFLLVAATSYRLKTREGTLVVEVDQPDAMVQVLDEQGKIQITRPGEKGTITIAVDPGKHRLKVSKDGFDVFGEPFEITTGGIRSINAKLVPSAETSWEAPAFIQWTKEVRALAPEEQVNAVVKRLQELNTGFDGKQTNYIHEGAVNSFSFLADHVTDLSPVRALSGLQWLTCRGSREGAGKLSSLLPLKGMHLAKLEINFTAVSDLTPLKGMALIYLACGGTAVADLSPIKGMPLQELYFYNTPVSDLAPLSGLPIFDLRMWMTSVSELSPLRGMPLRRLEFGSCPISDLSPLKGAPLDWLDCERVPVSDLSALQGLSLTYLNLKGTRATDLSALRGMKLNDLCFTPKDITAGIDAIRRMKDLTTIRIGAGENEKFSPAEFWKKYDHGDFN